MANRGPFAPNDSLIKKEHKSILGVTEKFPPKVNEVDKLRLQSREEISKVLGLDKWESLGNIETAKTRIIQCFKENSLNLNLKELKLSSIPLEIFQFLPQLQILDLSSNQLTELNLPASVTQPPIQV